MPYISVIVPVYKVEKYLHRCVDSILAQTFANFELILVDDGSPDNCGTICDEYAKLDKRIHVIHQENGGLSSARNTGIDWAFENSDSKWLTFIDSDDWVHPQYLEFLYSANIEFDTSVSVCDFVSTYDNMNTLELKNFLSKKMSTEEFVLQYYRLSNIACAKLYKKECFSDIRYPIGKLHEDAFTTYKIMFKDSEISVVDVAVYYYRQSAESIMRSSWTPKRLDEFEALEEKAEFFKANGFKEIYKLESHNLIYRFVGQIKQLKNANSDEYKQRYEPIMRKMLKKKIRFYKKHWNDFKFKGNEWIYEQAYPDLMRWYWIMNSVKNKILRKK